MDALIFTFLAGHLVTLVIHRGRVVLLLVHAGASLAVLASLAGFGAETVHDEDAGIPRDAGPTRYEMEEGLGRTHQDDRRVYECFIVIYSDSYLIAEIPACHLAA